MNTKYKIPGYKLTKVNKELKIIKDYRKATTETKANTASNNDKLLNGLISRINIMEKQIKEITDYLQNMNN